MFIISMINESFRALPIIGPSSLFLYYYYKKDTLLLYLFFGSLFIILINFIMKDYIFKYIENNINYYNFYTLQNTLGIFERPPGAKNCGIFYTGENNYSFTRGMPSGHSLLAGYMSTVLYYYLINKYNIKKKNKQNDILILCIIFTFLQ